ncbi:hypothetical protein ABKA04_005696 [Annulohypoxylon sp. FPYF3050]
MMYERTVVVVKGVVLRNALRNIFMGAKGFQLTGQDIELEDPRFFFWARKELGLISSYFKDINDEQSLFEIDTGLLFIDSEWSKTISVLDDMLPHSISFEYLWAIFPPDCFVVGTDALNNTTIWKARFGGMSRQADGSIVFVIQAENIDWDGERLGISSQSLHIPSFSGAMAIEDLPFIPLQHHQRKDQIIPIIRGRSQKKMEFVQEGFKTKQYEGYGLIKADSRHYFQSRVIIDPKMMDRTVPKNDLVPKLGVIRTVDRVWISEFIAESDTEKFKAVLKALLKNPDEVSHKRNSRQQQMTDFKLNAEQELLLSSLVYGYSLKDATWGAFTVDHLSNISWNDKAFDSLVMDAQLKNIIYRLVKTHSSDASDFDDFIQGKGKGLVGLLDGPPGAGKTLTAEAIAETAHMPLYTISSGALGHEADQIYQSLTRILELTAHWKAMLLLDEADVFLAKRNETDLKRNAIGQIIDSAFQTLTWF